MVVGTTLEGLLSISQPKPSELTKSATEEAGQWNVHYKWNCAVPGLWIVVTLIL